MKKLVFYVPKDSAKKVKDAVFGAGAGTIGNYDCCSFETEGSGQFRPLKGSSPYLGEQGVLEKVIELRIETICPDEKLLNVIEVLKDSHPYEEPAIDVYELVNF